MSDQIILRERVITIKTGDTFDQAIQGNVLRVTTGAVPLRVQSRDGQLDFTLLAGEKASFPYENPGLILSHTSGADQTFTVQVGKGVDIASALLSGSVVISGTPTVIVSGNLAGISNTVKTVNDGLIYGGTHKSVANLAALTAQPIFTPAANVNGAILHLATIYSYGSSVNPQVSLIAKTSAPASAIDGDVFLMCVGTNAVSTAAITLERAVKIPAGMGLYFISTVTESVGARCATYTLL